MMLPGPDQAFGPLAPLLFLLVLLVAGLLVLRWIRGARFVARPLLNTAEQRVHAMLGREVPRSFGKGARLFAQVSYGEFLTSRDRRAFWSINARRADFLVTDAAFVPLCVIEYQGSGHFGPNAEAAMRARHGDKVKRRALASAGVALVELPARVTPQLVAEMLARAACSSAARTAGGATTLPGDPGR